MRKFLRLFLILFITNAIMLPEVYAATKHKSKASGHKKSKKSKIRTKPHSDDYMDGVASCYANFFVGRKTTSGDRFTMDRYTGAHPTLPMRTKLKVTNTKNGKVVYIEVNDRMAKSSGHVIDLPKKSAEALGMRCPTLTIAHLEILDNDTYNSLLKGQIGQSILLSSTLLTDDQQLEIANQFAQRMSGRESVPIESNINVESGDTLSDQKIESQ